MNQNLTERCGYVAIMGETNAGKSTLVNTLVGEKVSIVTHKINTTRRKVLGIVCHAQTQCIFMDTPGLMNRQDTLNRALVRAAWESFQEADIVCIVIDAQKGLSPRVRQIMERAKKAATDQTIIALNKIDLVDKASLLELTQQLQNSYPEFGHIFMISAKKANGTNALMDYFTKHLPYGPWLYPEDQLTDMPMRENAAEITREKLFIHLHEELPYGLFVETESWEEKPDKVTINQAIVVGKEHYKPMVLGRGGSKIKTIGTLARKELEESLGKSVRLNLFVKVRENWQEKASYYKNQGLAP